MQDIAKGVKYLHDHQVVHLDLKPLNALRLEGDHICITDMDAASSLSENSSDIEENISYAGEKFSSGILPPEMFYKLKSSAEEKVYREYWQHVDPQSSMSKKIAPVRTCSKKVNVSYEKAAVYVVRSHTLSKIRQSDVSLPYTLVPASRAIDAWSFGVMLFQLLSGETLVPVNRDDDLAGPEAVLRAATWTDDSIEERIREFYFVHKSNEAIDLLKKLLKVNAQERLCSMADVLNHSFFHIENNLNLDTKVQLEDLSQRLQQSTKFVEDMKEHFDTQVEKMDSKLDRMLDLIVDVKSISTKVLGQIKKTERVLLRGLFEKSNVPSSFIIVPNKLVSSDRFLNQSEETSSVITENISSWLNMLADTSELIASAIQDKRAVLKFPLMDEYFESMKSSKFYFYLVDEFTMQPVIPDADDSIYPIVITQQSAFMKKVIPMLRVYARCQYVIC